MFSFFFFFTMRGIRVSGGLVGSRWHGVPWALRLTDNRGQEPLPSFHMGVIKRQGVRDKKGVQKVARVQQSVGGQITITILTEFHTTFINSAVINSLKRYFLFSPHHFVILKKRTYCWVSQQLNSQHFGNKQGQYRKQEEKMRAWEETK